MTSITIVCSDCQKTYNGLMDEPTPHLCQGCRITVYKDDRDIWQAKLMKSIRAQVTGGDKKCTEEEIKNDMTQLRIKLIEQWIYDSEHGVTQSDVRRLYR